MRERLCIHLNIDNWHKYCTILSGGIGF